MKHIIFLSGSVLLATAALAQQAAPPPVSLPGYLQRAYGDIKRNLTAALEKMPSADLNFKPGSAPEMRTYGKLFGHVANAQYGSCAAAKGVPNPNQGQNQEQKNTTKEEFAKALSDSFAFCDDAFSTVTEANAMQMVAFRRGQMARAAVLADLIAHSDGMYGYASVYLRAKGIVPPSTDEAAAAQRGRGGN